MKTLADRAALKELVDRVSILADNKEFDRQVLLFTENAISETFANGKSILKLQGRKAMAEAFGVFLKDFDTIYHFNGQQVVTVNGNMAAGTVYCTVTLIGNEQGKKVKTTIGAVYRDDYVREDDQWLIAGRIGNFAWQDKQEII
jgi:hypothetical protein